MYRLGEGLESMCVLGLVPSFCTSLEELGTEPSEGLGPPVHSCQAQKTIDEAQSRVAAMPLLNQACCPVHLKGLEFRFWEMGVRRLTPVLRHETAAKLHTRVLAGARRAL